MEECWLCYGCDCVRLFAAASRCGKIRRENLVVFLRALVVLGFWFEEAEGRGGYR